ncbi:putative DNA-binding domain-containing protein [Neptuniibacter sp. QD29_5]|uniref:HvfC/BufC family peptide modification chaperone n=1 Tax=Neptuniibacter sp. QD29_5 TaxID=3398207 RepID=UPI0039F5A7E1
MLSDSTLLVRRQAALMTLIFSNEESDTVTDRISQGLKIYQNNLLMTAARAISLKYPVLEQMVSNETIVAFTNQLLKKELPKSGDWADWGGMLPALISESSLADDHAYLSEVARLEWFVHQAARGKVAQLEVETLSNLTESDLDSVSLHLSPTLQVMESHFPVYELWGLHQVPDEEVDEGELYRLLVGNTAPHYSMVFQQDYRARIQTLTAQEYAWFRDVLAGMSVERLLGQHQEIDFVSWIEQAINQQWLVAIK